MIKGVSRQVVEVTNTGNPFFERALLVVRPSYTDQPTDTLQKAAQHVLHSQNGYTGLQRARRWRYMRQAAWVLLGGVLGVLVEKVLAIL